MKIQLILLILLFLYACNNSKKPENQADKNLNTISDKWTRTQIRYAENFTIQYFKDYKLIEIIDAENKKKKIATYLLLNKGKKIPKNLSYNLLIEIPLASFVCLSTTELPLVEELNLLPKLLGVPFQNYISSAKIHQLIKEKKVQIVGGESGLNLETIASLNPALTFTTTPFSADNSLEKLKELGLKTVFVSSYLENHPLGRAEWIKFMAAFFDKEKEANRYFEMIEKEYLRLAKLTKKVKKRPTVFTNIPFKDVWYMPGGKGFMAKFFEDAGAEYCWKNEKKAKSLSLDFEAVYAQAAQADFWIHTGYAHQLKDLTNQDTRFADFEAFRKKQVFNNNKRQNERLANDFYESGSLKPEQILADLIYIFHPDLLPEHQFYYYKKLE